MPSGRTRRPGERLGVFALLALSLVFCAGIAELTARLTVGRGTPPLPPGRLPLGRYHPLLGWEKTPLATAHIQRSEYDVHVEINGHGMRGPERDYAKPPGTRRILILGDSFGEGYYVEEPQTARALLERGLQASCVGVEVLNGSTAGYSTDQEYLFFTSEGARYRPDLVILFVYSNDLPDNLSAVGNAERPKPVFVLHEGELVLRNTPVPKARDSASETGTEGLRPFHHSVALRWLSNRTAESPRLHALLTRIGLVPALSTDPPRDFWPFRIDRRLEDEEMWKRFTALLHSLKDAVEDSGGHLAVLYVPVRFEVEDPAWSATLARYPPLKAWDRDRVVRQLEAACTKVGVVLVDPRASLRGAGAPAYFPKDGHWNALGNAVVSEVLRAPLERLLACKAAPP
jgi:hypothetical protein